MRIRNKEYRNRILELVNILRYVTPERVRLEYMHKYKKRINWITVKRHLECLTEEKFIEKEVISKGIKRCLCIFKSK